MLAPGPVKSLFQVQRCQDAEDEGYVIVKVKLGDTPVTPWQIYVK